MRLKRIISGLGAFIVAFAAVLPVNAQYIDPEVYSNAVTALVSAKVIDGGGNVRLTDYVNRAETLKVILLAQSQLAPDIERVRSSLPALSMFPDVDQRQWYAPYIETGYRYGLIKGYPDGRFIPQGGVKVVEAVAMVTRAFGEQTDSAPFSSSDDLPNQQGQWYTGPVSAVIARNAILAGSRLKPGSFMTRGQLFDLVYRMREVHTRRIPAFVGNSEYVPVGSSNGGGSSLPITQSESAQYASTKPFAITIPSLGIVDLAINHPDDPYTDQGVVEPLTKGVGHLFSYPGNGGKVVVYGHSSGWPWDISKFTKIFRTINQLNIGDKIYVTYQGKLYVYQVSEKKTIAAKDNTAFEPDDRGEELVLYTCWPPDSISQRYLVYGTPVETIALK
jgi:LPXTG-site transpeptidase (sortase) family protein